LLKRLGKIARQSCVLLTTREKPQAIAAQEGDLLPVRTLHLEGVDTDTGRQIVVAKGLAWLFSPGLCSQNHRGGGDRALISALGQEW
jgi:hypothetical protein